MNINGNEKKNKKEIIPDLNEKSSKIIKNVEKTNSVLNESNPINKTENQISEITIKKSTVIESLLQNSANLYSNINERINKQNILKSKKKKKIQLVTCSLILGYNKISCIEGIHNICDSIFINGFESLQWLDLQHNHLVSISPDIVKLPNLKSLYLHANYINNMRELVKLKPLESLTSITIHGNPLVRITDFRLHIIFILPHLKKIDTVLISEAERAKIDIWRDKFNLKHIPSYNGPYLKVPPKPKNEEKEG